MFFLFGSFLGALVGALAMTGCGVALGAMRWARLLVPGVRWWWLLAVLPAATIARRAVLASHGDRVPEEQLAKGFYLFQAAGVVAGIALAWLIGMLVWSRLERSGVRVGSRVPVALASLFCAVGAAGVSIGAYRAPHLSAEANEARRVELVAALQRGDVARAVELVVDGASVTAANPELEGAGALAHALRHGSVELACSVARAASNLRYAGWMSTVIARRDIALPRRCSAFAKNQI